MINPKNRLTIVHYDGATYNDYTKQLVSFGRDPISITLETDDYLYIGYTKSINALFTNVTTINTNTSIFTLEYYNGTSWVVVDSFDDDSKGYSRSAFFQWDRNLETDTVTQPDGSMTEQYYYRLSVDANTSAMTFQGLNLIFADDEDLRKSFARILDGEILQGETSHILIHEEVRNEIVQRFRNRGIQKLLDESLGGKEDILPWDLLEIQEVRQGAVFLALHKIFFNMSDSPDDVWNQKSLYYKAVYEDQIDIVGLTWDKNNDGTVDDNERKAVIKADRMSR